MSNTNRKKSKALPGWERLFFKGQSQFWNYVEDIKAFMGRILSQVNVSNP